MRIPWKLPGLLRPRQALLLCGLLAVPGPLLAAVYPVPIEFRQESIAYNFQCVTGAPSSTVNESYGSDNPPTANQFRNFLSFGAIPGLVRSDWQAVSNSTTLREGTTPFSGSVAEQMRLPIARSNSGIALIVRRAQVGAPYLSRQVSFAFGQLVEVPETDEYGRLLTNVVKETYWKAEPYSANHHTNAAYYWSPNAEKVFAIQPGPLLIAWKKDRAYTAGEVPAGYVNPNGPPNFETNGGNIYVIYTARYVVSGSAVKTPRKIYWTQRQFSRLGKPVVVPPGRVSGVQIVYNNNFPKEVEEEYSDSTTSEPGGTNEPLRELRTLYHDTDTDSIRAYNREGRVFVELLGDERPGGLGWEHLGYEIVDVIKRPAPADLTVELGERIVPPPPGSVEEHYPEPISDGTITYAYRHQPAGSSRPQYYATRETANQNDYVVHWLEESLEGLKWPFLLGRYKLAWPADAAKYSHYVRPVAATEAEAKETAVALAIETVPTIEYQDPLDRPRAKLTETFKFYTWLDADRPAHRTLLRFTAGDDIAFERVFSWLDAGLRHPNLARPVFNTDFDAPPAGATLHSNAVVTGGILKLTDAIGNQNGTCLFSDFTGGQSVENFRATFKVSIRGGSARPADGFSFNFGTLATRLDEEGTTNGLAVTFDSWDNNAGDVAPTIAIKYDGTIVAAVAMGETNVYSDPEYVLPIPNDPATGRPMTLFTGDQFVNVKIELRSGGQMDVFYKDVKVLADVASGYTPRTGQFGLGGRTGGSYSTHWIDDLGIAVNLDLAAGTPAFGSSVATNLDSWVTDTTFNWPDALTAPRVVRQTADVGQRLAPPSGETGASGSYLAGHIHRDAGKLYNPQAYFDPLEVGFTLANAGAIIPVNAIPGTNTLEVWWFRTNTARAGLNAGDQSKGFKTIYWPSVLGRYTLHWPGNPKEIVLASLVGSGSLSSREAAGTIYRQNDPDQDGYNPNEEHALMSGGQAFATRDDLNLTNSANYSSHPFVLLSYTASDGRPAMTPFRVLREKPEAGYVFDYIVPAGRILQAPMPLPLLAKPVEGTGDNATNYNTEPSHSGGDLPGGWTAASADGPYGHYQSFTWRDRHHDFWVYRGLHAGLPALQAGTYDETNRIFLPRTNATAVADQSFCLALHASRQDEMLALTCTNLPGWLRVSGLRVEGTPRTNDVGTNLVQFVVEDLYDHGRVTNVVRLEVVASGTVNDQPPLSLVSSNQYTGNVVVFSNRPPFLAESPAASNSFTLRFYYKTEPGFDWPGVAEPPAAGSIVPYLRPRDPATNQFVGDPASKQTESLEIVYRPVWPVRDPSDASKPVPTLRFGATLAKPKSGLPGVRSMLTAHVLYQQSVAANLNLATPSGVLHDPTRAKFSDLAAQSLTALPGGVRKDYYQGRYYFPNLPPHLAQRLYYDPNRGSKGSLVLKGLFVDELLGESYLLLNVLRGSDLTAALDLCPDADPDKSAWDTLVQELATDMETFHESPSVPGTYVPNDDWTVSVGVGALAQVTNANAAVDSYALSAVGPGSGYVTLVESSGTAFTQPGDPVAMHIFKVGGDSLDPGEVKVLTAANPLSEQVTFQHTADLAGRFNEFEYEWKIATPVDGQPPAQDDEMTRYQALDSGTNMPRRTIGGAGIQALCDNYVVMRYRAVSTNHPLYNQWSDWTSPKLGEGWIKRVLAGINPFNQRINDLFNNQVNTDVSMLTQAGRRWEGDVALNLENINDFGLIEIYETVLRRGRMLSIESGYNYGPANDALLLAAGYLSDLYLMVGNEAWADAANPTIGIGTEHLTYGSIATALFAFKGQTASLLDEELALLRGRDDFLVPGVEVTPVYNRLIWNYTRGIDAGEVIYALNYNIQEDPNRTPDGIINAEDAAIMFPQGHGDAYGHFLTALKGYYSLLLNSCFDWVPRSEAVNVLGQPVSVDYQDERKFAAAATAVARAGRQVFDLTWRQSYQPVHTVGWEHLGATRVNAQRTFVVDGTNRPSVRHWGLDHWACRTGQGMYLNWLVGNAILPDVDPNPDHEGIQKIDRTTVPELKELATAGDSLQTALDNAEGGLSPLGIPEGGLAFDINPSAVVGTEDGTHFEQIYRRAKLALNNAVAAFDDAKDVTALMRMEQNSLADFRASVSRQELAYRNALIELYGTPYPDDIGPGKQYPQDYAGPDLIHYMYVETPEYPFPELWSFTKSNYFRIDVQDLPSDWAIRLYTSFQADNDTENNDTEPWMRAAIDTVPFNTRPLDMRQLGVDYIEFNIGAHGFGEKPAAWTSQRASPGKLQQAISEYIMAHTRLRQAMNDAAGAKNDFDKAAKYFESYVKFQDKKYQIEGILLGLDEIVQWAKFADEVFQKFTDSVKTDIRFAADGVAEALPGSMIVGVASGGDLTSAGRAALKAAGYTTASVLDKAAVVRFTVVKALETLTETSKRWVQYRDIQGLEWDNELKEKVLALGNQMSAMQGRLWTINERLRELDDAARKKQALLAEGDRIQEERLIYRQRAAAIVQGYRTRDAAFRLFRAEKLERYKTLFDLAARYSLLAANAYDYETGLLNTPAGRAFIQRIISARALGVVRNGEPQYAGSDTGDPGLSSALAEMRADWEVLRGRLGFNNPDAYGTTVSLRTEAFRILPTTDGDTTWKDLLQASRMRNILEDQDVHRYCMQVADPSGLPVPGIVLPFSTTIADGYNLFGRQLAAGDHAFSPSSFATKIFGVGVALIGYRGMDDPTPGGGGGVSPPDPPLWYLDPLALAATPYVYLVPVGVDAMRSPPLGDASVIRTWMVDDLAIPMPFNIGESGLNTQPLWQSSDSLTERLFAIRKHQAFRPVSTTAVFSPNLYTANGTLQRSQFTNNRLVARSVWNSQWKLVIPGRTLLNDPNEGLDRFLQTVTDVRLHFVTYSYSGN